MVTEEEVREALLAVNDPHIPTSIESMGMLRGIEISETGVVDVELAIPCLACPGVSMLKQSINDAVGRLEGVRKVNILEGWHHEWTTEAIDPGARQLMRRFGIQV
ncbi:metal-sulfur cluster assembly factor [Bradyrhizobium canariense]|uniref:metal-sulfur cluster assembly factor n=1 Tax=Bradyrhizobium canariense TaxID=255045 RepID=UPI001B8A754D|nr:iron-sulfur cluster assembly protein [Bradyrhizobium canariense]MBR0954918.1 iron-sulfur cluster assembly protein [Bradyrhizobium canariense]